MTQEPYARRRALPRSCGLLSLWLIAVCSLPAAVLAQTPAFLVKDIDVQPVTASSYPRGAIAVGSTTFFITDTDNGSALWTTDGSEQGTVRVKDFPLGCGAQE